MTNPAHPWNSNDPPRAFDHTCPACGRFLRVPLEHAGQLITCPVCRSQSLAVVALPGNGRRSQDQASDSGASPSVRQPPIFGRGAAWLRRPLAGL